MKITLPNVNEIYGFKTKSPQVLIFKHGMPFYYRTNKNGVLFFNLPSGEYDIVTGELLPATPVIYPTLNLDDRNNYTDVKKLKIVIAPNVNRATIDLDNCVAVIDPKLAKEPEFVVKYIIGHEYGHNLYRGLKQKSELACDKLACDTMLKIGYNPNQCIAAIRMALSNRPLALARKNGILNELNNIKNGIITGD